MTISTAPSLPTAVRLQPHSPICDPPSTLQASRLQLRTANAFTLPLGQLLSEPQSSHDDAPKCTSCKNEDADNAMQLMLSADRAWMPAPLRTIPFWRSVRGPHKCIVYLEPRRGSPLYTGIEEFFRASCALWGPTEAHMYHPHSSMTGFIDLPTDAGAVIARIACHLHVLISSRSHMVAPGVRAVTAVADYPHPGTHKIDVALDTPLVFRNIVDEVSRLVPEARIRPKRMGHISLAYCNKHVASSTVVTSEQAEKLGALARSLLYMPDVFDPAQNPWDIAFYELSFKSPMLGTPHRFTQIARWQL
ncbi:hypothetical protein LPJ69_001465 [Coemansia sp. RSA 1752]|nr:hypothetical protein LPJ69_001465 [Coemansia sp. RSA 1752]KAJ1793303.1 hypothetical protein LPJ67_001318 [Coemansia sp. RSA 1938]KAJ2439565.1 hypothetical protein IWW46_004389 [Coemansia sp. RSA 2440]